MPFSVMWNLLARTLIEASPCPSRSKHRAGWNLPAPQMTHQNESDHIEPFGSVLSVDPPDCKSIKQYQFM